MTTTVSPTSHSENAYIPTWYETFRSLNQEARCSNWSPCEKSKRVSDSIQKPTSTSDTSSANGAVARRPSGSTKQASAPATGRKIRIVCSQLSTSAHRDEDDDEDREAARERERVRADEPGLHPCCEAAGLARAEPDLGDRARDQQPLDPAQERLGEPDGRTVEHR